MSVYVDEVQSYPMQAVARSARHCGRRWCHLWTDPGNEEELHRMAAALELKPQWFQNRKGFPHYDLVPARREAAIRLGATPMSLRDWWLTSAEVPNAKELSL